MDAHFAEEKSHLIVLPACPCDAVLTVDRLISQDGIMVAVRGNHQSVLDASDERRQQAFEYEEANTLE